MIKKNLLPLCFIITATASQLSFGKIVLLAKLEEKIAPIAVETRDCLITSSAYLLSVIKTTRNLFKDEKELPLKGFQKNSENETVVYELRRESRKEIQQAHEKRILQRMNELLKNQGNAEALPINEDNETEYVALLPELLPH